MLSPNSFVDGADSDPLTANSCHVGWGNVTSQVEDTVVCAGITNISGTGPFKFVSRTPIELDGTTTVDGEVVFEAFEGYWGGAPDIETLKIVRYEDSDAVKAALEDGTLDLVWGSGVLSPDHINEIAASSDNDLSVYHSDDIQNVVILLNSGKPPLDNIQVRKTIIHAVNKKKIINDNLGGLFKPVDNVFPRDAPFSGKFRESCTCIFLSSSSFPTLIFFLSFSPKIDVDIFPRWDYDIEKAHLLNCPSTAGEENIAELESQLEEVTKEKELVTAEKESLTADRESLSTDKETLTTTKDLLEAEKESLKATVSEADKQISDLTDKLNAAQILAKSENGASAKFGWGLIGVGFVLLSFCMVL